ncbi:MAG TPA: serine/threonine-protein kinase [Gemmataceae bacterium]|nr:serine/threonine-protein kinase [Gemmataceae bacterium]
MAVDAKTVKAIFLAALDRASPADRAGYLDEACAGDVTLRQSVEALLRSHDQPDALLDQPAVQHIPPPPDTAVLDFLEPSAKPGVLRTLGHYDVLEIVGQGGMGVVMRAFDAKLHRVVAIKALLPGFAGDSDSRKRFVREAQAAAAVTHDNVIAIHAVEDGPVPYLVMQFIDGCTLQDKLDRGGPLPLKEVLRIGLQMAEGLAAAHRHGLIHRDIKPGNILLENGIQRVKITDFGLARAVDDPRLTRSGYIAGTPAFMSPEQASGERVDHRSDLFSLGSVLYYLCAGHPPFQAETSLGIMKRVCEETPRPLHEVNPDTPEWLQALIARLHAKKPTDRFASAAEVAALLGPRLARLQADGSSSDVANAPSTHLRPRPEARRRRAARSVVAAALVVAVALVGGLLIYKSWGGKRQSANTDTPDPSGPAARPAPVYPVVLTPAYTRTQHTSGVRSVAISRDGKVLASGGLDHSIYLWDTKTWTPRGPLTGHTGEVPGLSFSPDDTRLASVTAVNDTCLIRLWNVATGEGAGTIGGPGSGMWDVAYSPDGQSLACGGWDKSLHVFSVATGVRRFLKRDIATRLVRQLSFSPDSRWIATGGSGRTYLWDTATGNEVPMPMRLRDTLCPTILPGGTLLAGWTHGEGKVTLCELPSGQIRGTPWRAHQGFIEAIAASADGRFIATVGSDGFAHVWSIADQTKVATCQGHKGGLMAAVFTPDGDRLITGSEDETIRVWNLPEICRTVK